MLPDEPDELIPAVEPIRRVAPALSVKIPGPLMIPVLVMVRSPLHKKVPPPDVTTTVPAMVPVAVEARVKFNLAEGAPRVRVFPEITVKLLLAVRAVPEVAAAKMQVPLIVRLERVIAGTAVMLAD